MFAMPICIVTILFMPFPDLSFKDTDAVGTQVKITKTVTMRGSPWIEDATAMSAIHGAQSRERN
jgi:hypothetical protein